MSPSRHQQGRAWGLQRWRGGCAPRAGKVGNLGFADDVGWFSHRSPLCHFFSSALSAVDGVTLLWSLSSLYLRSIARISSFFCVNGQYLSPPAVIGVKSCLIKFISYGNYK